MYFMARGYERQIGITGDPYRRLAVHRRDGWVLLEITTSMPGYQAADIERQIKRALRHWGYLMPGSTEQWWSGWWNPSSLQEIWAQTGVSSTSIAQHDQQHGSGYVRPAPLKSTAVRDVGLAVGVGLVASLLIGVWALLTVGALWAPWVAIFIAFGSFAAGFYSLGLSGSWRYLSAFWD